VILRCSAKHDRISTIGCVTLSPQAMHVGLYGWSLINRNVHGEQIVEFLKYLTHKVPGEWTVVWDRNNTHSKSKVVKAWLAQHPNVVVEDFPGYTPDANAAEWVWSWAKYGKLCNACPADVEELFEAVLTVLDDLKRQPSLLASFVMAAGVPLSLPRCL
jgi:transposase